MEKVNNHFQKLTPTKDMELKIYEDAIDFIFSDNAIKNVAISGPYSSGKSSVIETYKSKHPNIRCLHISLAHFDSTEHQHNTNKSEILESNTSDQNSINHDEQLESIIEGKILNQLIHQIDPNKIPKTNFKVKNETIYKEITNIVFFIMTTLILAFYIRFYGEWNLFVQALKPGVIKTLLLITTNYYFLLTSGINLNILLGYGLFTIIKFQKDKSIFKRLNFQGSEIEIFEESDDSYFDKYLNEVLYLFENSNVEAIIFEDIDRYNVNRIFERLREVNTLVNNHLLKKEKKVIRFIYLLRDDIFVSKDRTKFFDFIIPVVPVIDGSNSYDQFIEHFKQGKIYELFDENFLQGLSLYIDDMRILKNIYNEFVIYYNQIQSTELNSNKLLAIIAYKNVFPRDYSDLQLGRGFVHTLISEKSEIIRNEVIEIENNIETLKRAIRLANDEYLSNIDELDAVFLILNQPDVRVSGTSISRFKTIVEAIRAMKISPNSVTCGPYGQVYDFKGALKSLSLDEEYTKRKEAIENNSEARIAQMEFEIDELQRKLVLILNKKLKDIITKDNIDLIFLINYTNEIGDINEFNEIKSSSYFSLIKYLIRNGYIDETYSDYMTYFYENSLSRIDKIFLRSITDQTPKQYNYKLKNPKTIISRLRRFDFNSEEIFNFDLLCYLLKTKDTNEEFLTIFLNQLNKKQNFKFICSFIENREEIEIFIKSINNLWPSIFNCILNNSDMTEAQIKQYTIYSLYYSPNSDIEILNEDNCLSDYILNNPDFLNIDAPNIDKIISGISLINARFMSINHDISNNMLFIEVYKNSLYELTFDNISLMLRVVYEIPESEDFNHKNYTLILSKSDEIMVKYVSEYINEYIRIVIDNSNGYIKDDESVVLSVLNNPIITPENREEYIDILRTKVEFINNINDSEFWKELLQRNLIKFSEENILSYYLKNDKGIDSYLIDFINNGDRKLHFEYELIEAQFNISTALNFYKSILLCNDLSNDKYTDIFSTLKRVFTKFSYIGIDDDKMLILIQHGVIKMNNENLGFMRENYPGQLISFICNNISIYSSEVITEENFIENEMLSLLEQEINDRYKIEQLKLTNNKISVIDKNYTNTIKLHILQHNLDKNDLRSLINTYLVERKNIKDSIKEISIDSIENIIDKQYELPLELVTELVESDKVSNQNKIELFIQNLPNMTRIQAGEYLNSLKMYNFISLFDRKRPKFEVNDVNKRILDIFSDKGWITKFEVDEDNPGYFRAFGRKIKELETEFL